MNGRFLEEIRNADQTVEQLVRVLTGDHEGPEDGSYPLPQAQVGQLAEPTPAPFDDVTPLQAFPRLSNPAIVLATADHNGLSRIDVLEALLYIADPQATCRQTAKQALQTFGSVGAVLAASAHDLTTRLGINEQVAYTLKAIHAGMCSVLREPIRERGEIGSLPALVEYLGLSLKHEPVEVLRVLYLDHKNGLISDEEAGRGTVDHMALYPREIVKRALELGASAVIMARNHPAGDSTPSARDVSMS